MKKTFVAAAFAAVVATPALAAGTGGSYGLSGPHAYSGYGAPYAAASVNANASYGYMSAGQPYAYAAPGVSSDVVVFDGEIIGRDPDANVRLQLHRDALLSPSENHGTPYGF